jgi:hypothetical protein
VADDPVTALFESDATGRIAEIFAEIRDMMRLPLITSIWRILASVDGGLESTWAAVKPLYLSAQPDELLTRLSESDERLHLPPIPPKISELAAGLSDDQISAVVSIFAAYNRSNELNFIALSALVNGERTQYESPNRDFEPIEWGELPTLLEQCEIEPSTWKLLEQIKHLGSDSSDSAIATLWRHLAHWPELLKAITESFEVGQSDGSLIAVVNANHRLTQQYASELVLPEFDRESIPDEAWSLVINYVDGPAKVNRMVVLGNSARRWLELSSRA